MSNSSASQEEAKEKEQKGFDVDFEFMPATRGLGSKVKGAPKQAASSSAKKGGE